MKCSIDPKILEMFPHVKIGVLLATNMDNSQSQPMFSDLLRAAEKAIRENFQLESLTSIPKIIDWREAYRTFGCKPSVYRSSIEALMRRVLQGKELPSINPMVDAYNLISLENVLPIGGGDIAQIEGDILLTSASGSERFMMLGGTQLETIKKGEVIYRDDKDVLCRAWNYRESEKSKITEKSKQVCFFVEGLEHTTEEEILHALSGLKYLLSPMCQGTIQQFLLSKINPEIMLDISF